MALMCKPPCYPIHAPHWLTDGLLSIEGVSGLLKQMLKQASPSPQQPSTRVDTLGRLLSSRKTFPAILAKGKAMAS